MAPRMWHVPPQIMPPTVTALPYFVHGKLGNTHETRLMLVNESWHARIGRASGCPRPSSMARAAGVLLSASPVPRDRAADQLCRSGDRDHHTTAQLNRAYPPT